MKQWYALYDLLCSYDITNYTAIVAYQQCRCQIIQDHKLWIPMCMLRNFKCIYNVVKRLTGYVDCNLRLRSIIWSLCQTHSAKTLWVYNTSFAKMCVASMCKIIFKSSYYSAHHEQADLSWHGHICDLIESSEWKLGQINFCKISIMGG